MRAFNKTYQFLVLGFLIIQFGSYAWAQRTIPGFIPRYYSVEAATDLPLSPEEAHQKAQKGELDLSTLEPNLNVNIWNQGEKEIKDFTPLAPGEKVRFTGELPTRDGKLWFSAKTSDDKEYIIVLSKKAHNLLLRKNILEKIGYIVPEMGWLPNLEVEFKDSIDRDLFKIKMKDKLTPFEDRWVKKESGLNLELMDVVVMSSRSDIYNLALGVMNPAVHQGRRLLRASYIPVSLVDTPESVNMMPWQAGRIVLDQIKLYHTQEISTDYGTSWEDARWIGRRIGRLSLYDWRQIVEKAYFPKAVEVLLYNKILARRNDLLKLLKLDDLVQKDIFQFDPEPNYTEDLVQGELTREFFPDRVSRFSYGDPESPFSNTELGFFVLSKLQSQVLTTGIEQLNSYLGTQDEKQFKKKLQGIVKDQGPFFPVQGMFIPSFHGGIILSRDIVAGTYLGSDNKVQLVDNIGFNFDGGVIMGVAGLPLPVQFGANANLSMQRLYSHVKPVETMKKSFKEPYKNMLVPFMMKKMAKRISELDEKSEQEQKELVGGIVKDLKASLGIGESFIVTDSLVPNIGANLDVSISQFFSLDPNLLRMQANFQSQALIISRFHLYRKSEDTFQLYKDSGKGLKLILTLKLRSYVPLIGFQARWNKAKAETKFFPLSLNSRDVSVPMLKALKRSILRLSTRSLSEVQTPHRVEHKLSESANTLELLFFKRNKIGTKHTLMAYHAKGGDPIEIHRRYDALTTGLDFESYATQSANMVLYDLLDFNSALAQTSSTNPGFSVGGRAKNKILTSEFDGQILTTTYERIFNGWKAKEKRLEKMIEQVNNEFGEEIFNPSSYQNTDSIRLYQIQVQTFLAMGAIERLMNYREDQFLNVLNLYAGDNLDSENREMLASYWEGKWDEWRLLLFENPDKMLKKYHQWLKAYIDYVGVKGLAYTVGEENIYFKGRVDGFRQGDEAGDQPIESDVFGKLPLPLHFTPSQKIMNDDDWGILEGELLLTWMSERAL